MSIKIILRMNNFNYDITSLVDTNNLQRTVEMKHTIDGQFHTGSIFMPNVNQYDLGANVDLSRAIIRNSLVNIEIGGKVYQWRVMADTVTDKLNDTYSHDIALLDRRSELTGINLPGLTLTQRSFASTEKVRATVTAKNNEKINLRSGMIYYDSISGNVYRYFMSKGIPVLSMGLRGAYIYKSNESLFGGLNGRGKVLANIYTSNTATQDWTAVGTSTSTSSSSFIVPSTDKVTLKVANKKYSFYGTINVFDSTPSTSSNIGDWDQILTNGSKYSTANNPANGHVKVLTVKAFKNSTLIYTHDFDITASSWRYTRPVIGNPVVTDNFPITPVNFNFDYTPTETDEEIVVKAEVKYYSYQTKLALNDASSSYAKRINEYWNYIVVYPTKINGYGITTEMKNAVEANITLGTTYSNGNWTIPDGGTLGSRAYKNFTYTGSSVTYFGGGKYYTNICELPSYLAIKDYSLIVETTAELVSATTKTLADWIDHALSAEFIGETERYTLEESTRSRLSQIMSPEFTAKDYNMYQLINEVAEFLGGVNWEITQDNKIKFIFFDKLEVKDLPVDDIDEQAEDGTSDLNGYQSAVQINAENVAMQSLVTEGWYSPRAEDVGNIQIKNDSIMIKTQYPINSIYKVEQKGIDYGKTGYSSTDVLNITPRVVEYEEWKTLPSQFSSYATDGTVLYGRWYFTKSNTLYYKRGQVGIYGLGYCGGIEPGFWTTSVGNRAIFETGAVQMFTENDHSTSYNTTNTDTGNAIDNAFKLRIQYYPFTSAKIMIYKDDLSGFQIERNTYMNESSQVNDPYLLGSVAKSRVNRLGGTEYTKSGYITSIDKLPELGSANTDGQRLTQIVTQVTDAYVKYFATYVNDYNKISTFVGKKSDYRLYEIPNKNIIDSTRVKRNRFAIGPIASIKQNAAFNTNYQNIFRNLETTLGVQDSNYITPNLARLVSASKTNYIPVLSGTIGSTAFWKLRAEDNYSVGESRTSYSLGGNTIYIQQDVPYTDEYGEFGTSYVSFKNGEVSAPEVFPNANVTDPTTGSYVFTEQLDYEKDSREIYGIEYQFSFHSTDLSTVRVYNGMTKYNSFLNGKTDYKIGVIGSYYIPNKEDILIDLSKCDPESQLVYNSSDFLDETSGFTGTKKLQATVKFTQYETTNAGVIYYDKNTRELLMWVKSPTAVELDTTYTISAYIRMIADPTMLTINILSNSDKDILSQTVPYGTPSISIDNLLTPYKTYDGYTYGGVFLDEEFTIPYNIGVNYYVVANMTLYLKFTPISGTKTWVETQSSLFDGETAEFTGNEGIPPDYTIYLPSVNDYQVGHIQRVRPIYIDPDNGIYDPEIDETVSYATSKYYKVT